MKSFLKSLFLLLLISLASTCNAQIMLGATYAEVKSNYEKSGQYFRWQESVTEQGGALITYKHVDQPRLLICCYFDGGRVKKFAQLGMYTEYWKQFGDYCVANYEGCCNTYLDRKNGCIWTLEADIPGCSVVSNCDNADYSRATATLSAEQAPAEMLRLAHPRSTAPQPVRRRN